MPLMLVERKQFSVLGNLLYGWVFEPFTSCFSRSAGTVPAAFCGLTLSAITSLMMKTTVYIT